MIYTPRQLPFKYSDTIFDKSTTMVEDKTELIRRQFLKNPLALKRLIKGMINASK